MTQDQFLEDLAFFEYVKNDSLNHLSNSQKAVLAEQADEQEKSIFQLMNEIQELASQIINYETN